MQGVEARRRAQVHAEGAKASGAEALAGGEALVGGFQVARDLADEFGVGEALEVDAIAPDRLRVGAAVDVVDADADAW